MSDTRFTETEALLAVLADDYPKAAQLIDGMLPGELQKLSDAATGLALLCTNEQVARQEKRMWGR